MLLNISITNCEAFYKQAIKSVLSKIKKDNSPGPMWSEHMCSINIISPCLCVAYARIR